MPNHRPSGVQALQGALDLLAFLVEQGRDVPLLAAAKHLGISVPTAYRWTAQLQRAGLLARATRGRYSGGLALIRMADRVDADAIVVAAARPVLKALSKTTGRVAHLGVFEDDMVTYLVRESDACIDVFTREGMQLEAYCTAIGKVLLAGLPASRRETYLATGEFVALTSRTLIDVDTLRDALAGVAISGVSRDDEESKEGLVCIAVPVIMADIGRSYAISLSGPLADDREYSRLHTALLQTQATLTSRLNAGRAIAARTAA